MNFIDFGIKDETGLEQDEFSLKRPTFGKDNQLTVIGWKRRDRWGSKLYIIRCTNCVKDHELFGDGLFETLKNVLISGGIPCGCSSRVRWTEDQYKTLIERKCKANGYVFHGFVGNFKGHETKLRLECPRHGNWCSTSIVYFVTLERFCPKCGVSNIKNANIKQNSYHINKFMSTGSFKEGAKFWRSEKVNNFGRSNFWNYTCPVCSNDEYVKAGLCSGVFESIQSSLDKGSSPCRCSNRYHWTQDQYEYRIKKKMQELKTTDEFVGFNNTPKNNYSKFKRFCVKHGEYESSINDFFNKNSCCPLCASHNQQECYINFIKNTNSIIALKFGIAKDSKHRVKSQNRKSSLEIEQYGIWIFPDVKSCKAAEKFIKQNLKCSILTKAEMPDGYTETTSVENLEAIIKIYEDFGGVNRK